MTHATVGKRYQLVIPRAERERLRIRPHSTVSVHAEGDRIVIYPVAAGSRRGIGRELVCEPDAKDYVRKLRAEWAARE